MSKLVVTIRIQDAEYPGGGINRLRRKLTHEISRVVSEAVATSDGMLRSIEFQRGEDLRK